MPSRGFAIAAAFFLGLSGAAAPAAAAARTGPASAARVDYHLVGSVPLGAPNPWDYVVYDPTSHRVFVAHGNRLTVADGRSGRIVGEVAPIPGGPHGIAFDPAAGVGITDDGEYAVPGDNGQLYVNGVTHHEIFRIDTRTHRLFSSCENRRRVVVDSESGAVVAAVPIGRGTDSDRFDPRSGLIFSSNGLDGTLSIIREVSRDEFVPAATVTTAPSVRTVPASHLPGVSRTSI